MISIIEPWILNLNNIYFWSFSCLIHWRNKLNIFSIFEILCSFEAIFTNIEKILAKAFTYLGLKYDKNKNLLNLIFKPHLLKPSCSVKNKNIEDTLSTRQCSAAIMILTWACTLHPSSERTECWRLKTLIIMQAKLHLLLDHLYFERKQTHINSLSSMSLPASQNHPSQCSREALTGKFKSPVLVLWILTNHYI